MADVGDCNEGVQRGEESTGSVVAPDLFQLIWRRQEELRAKEWEGIVSSHLVVFLTLKP